VGRRNVPEAGSNQWVGPGCHIRSHRKSRLPRIQTFEPFELSNHATRQGQLSNGGGIQRDSRSNG